MTTYVDQAMQCHLSNVMQFIVRNGSLFQLEHVGAVNRGSMTQALRSTNDVDTSLRNVRPRKRVKGMEDSVIRHSMGYKA